MEFSSALRNINSHLMAFDNQDINVNLKHLEQDNALLEKVEQNALDKQTEKMANEVLVKLDQNLKRAHQSLTTRPSLSAQSQVASHLDKETKIMKKRILDILKKPPVHRIAVEKNYKPKT